MVRVSDPHMTPAKWVKAVVLIVIPFVIMLAVGFVVLDALFIVRKPHSVVELTSEMAGRPVERVIFAATDGVELVGWFIPHPDSRAVIVFSHGSGSNGPSLWLGGHGRFLYQGGYSIFLFDHRGHGQSPGRVTTLGPREVRDFLGAVRYLHSRPDVDPERIGAFGLSMGSGVALAAAAEEPAIKAVVADSVLADLGVTVRDRMGKIDTPWGRIRYGTLLLWLTNLITGEDLADFRPIDAVPRISPGAVFLINGDNDWTGTNPDDARALYAAAGDPKELWIVPGAGHVEAYYVAGKEYEERLLAFFDRYLRGSRSQIFATCAVFEKN